MKKVKFELNQLGKDIDECIKTKTFVLRGIELSEYEFNKVNEYFLCMLYTGMWWGFMLYPGEKIWTVLVEKYGVDDETYQFF